TSTVPVLRPLLGDTQRLPGHHGGQPVAGARSAVLSDSRWSVCNAVQSVPKIEIGGATAARCAGGNVVGRGGHRALEGVGTGGGRGGRWSCHADGAHHGGFLERAALWGGFGTRRARE